MEPQVEVREEKEKADQIADVRADWFHLMRYDDKHLLSRQQRAQLFQQRARVRCM